MEVAKYTERLVPSTRFVAVDGLEPSVSESAAFVAPSASIIGDVTLGANSRCVLDSIHSKRNRSQSRLNFAIVLSSFFLKHVSLNHL